MLNSAILMYKSHKNPDKNVFYPSLEMGKNTVKKFDVVSLGEILIDSTQKSVNDLEFTANPGGAPCNVLAQLSRLGKKPHF